MADCDDLFKKFHDEIKLSESKREYLRQARDALRKKIKNYFGIERKESPPMFWGQGSYTLDTIVNPLNSEYDIDDGIYLQNLDKGNRENWPTPETVHNWIRNAVKGHTVKDPIDKRTCIRVIYSADYHVDLPIYGEYKNKYYLAEKGENGWHLSDPKALSEWFTEQIKENGAQLRNIVRYLKAWADYKSKSKDVKLPSGLILAVLVAENYVARDRDDNAFGRLIRNIYQKIIDSFIVFNPVDHEEILTDDLTDAQKKNFRELLSELMNNADKALSETSKREACKIWSKEFGVRFPCCDNIEEEVPLITSSPAILRDDARSA